MIISDTHAHYTDPRFETEHPGGAAALLDLLFAGDTALIIDMATSSRDIPEVLGLASRYPSLYAGIGIHPSEVGSELPPEAALASLESLLRDRAGGRAVCIGEIGLDYHRGSDDRELQLSFFRGQMELARMYGLPVSVHDRDAHADTMAVIAEYPDVSGVMHCFSGSAESAKALAARGWYIGIGGVITFRGARRVKEAAAAVPVGSLLTETDCPYLSPEPFRGRLNRSDRIVYVLNALAEVLGIGAEDLACTVLGNAKRLFSIV